MIWIAALLIGFAFALLLGSVVLRVILLLSISTASAIVLWPVIKKYPQFNN
jgi:membrane protein implicated in regulation of membrane protease activity